MRYVHSFHSTCMQVNAQPPSQREIPEKWRAASLSKIEMPEGDQVRSQPLANVGDHDQCPVLVLQRTVLPGCYYRDSDYCFLDDLTEGDYVDLTLNPERFTGYAGPSSQRVWKAIYQENCFGLSELNLLSSNSPNPGLVSLPDSMTGALQADGEDTKECLERRVYYKIVSGLHASISTHICHEDMNQTTGTWVRSSQL